jgi:chemotaxis protein methyltransferase CheR
MLMAEKMGTFGFRNLEIYATDHDSPLLRTLSEGIYRYEELTRVPEAYFSKYFEPIAGDENRFRVVDRLRAAMRVHTHDLLSLKSIRDGFSLVVCKNVLLHFQISERIEVIQMFHRALEPEGLLVMEHTQKLPQEMEALFEPVVSDRQLFRKRELVPYEASHAGAIDTRRPRASETFR